MNQYPSSWTPRRSCWGKLNFTGHGFELANLRWLIDFTEGRKEECLTNDSIASVIASEEYISRALGHSSWQELTSFPDPSRFHKNIGTSTSQGREEERNESDIANLSKQQSNALESNCAFFSFPCQTELIYYFRLSRTPLNAKPWPSKCLEMEPDVGKPWFHLSVLGVTDSSFFKCARLFGFFLCWY